MKKVYLFRSYLPALFLLWLLPASGQNDTLDTGPAESRRWQAKTRGIYNPQLLANTLTEGLNSDKEKFRAIFGWVVNNFDYDYAAYFSSGVNVVTVRQLLKAKTGVCLHYATLMDTLCAMAGIVNVSVYGYAKDEIFDVQDSIYIDNHAWNAVKLDGQWYVYDVTFASGTPYYRFTRFSEFIMKLKKHFVVKYRREEIRPPRRLFRSDPCGSNADPGPKTIVVFKPYMRWRFFYKLLSQFRIRLIRDFKKEMNPDYYLCQPEVLAITHFPDNPSWSLVAGKTMRQFEEDSAYYHLSKTVYGRQQRGGRTCMDCDGELSLDAMNSNFNMRRKSLAFNPRNRFIATLCEYNIAGLKYDEAQKAQDSLTRVTLLDTSLAFLGHARANILRSYSNVLSHIHQQKVKDRKKLNGLTDSDQEHIRFIREKMHITFQETRNIRDLENRRNLYRDMLIRRRQRIRQLTGGSEVELKSRVESAVLTLQAQHVQLLGGIDSLNRLIARHKTGFDTLLPPLSTMLWRKVRSHDSILEPLFRCISRRQLLRDDYKKDIVELRKTIDLTEKRYGREMDSAIYRPAAACYTLGNLIFRLIDERNALESGMHKVKRQLVKFGALAPGALDAYKKLLLQENQEDLCWLTGGNTYLISVFSGFKALAGSQKAVEKRFSSELSVEVARYLYMESELNRRRRQYARILGTNRRVVNQKAKVVRKYKREYLKSLREELKEARKNS